MKILLAILLVVIVSSKDVLRNEQIEVRRSIIDSYMEGSSKLLFKVFHFVFNKTYSINSEIGLEKYKIFKKNLAFIKEHNNKKLSWTLEVNFLADTTLEERKALMGIIPINTNKRGLLDLEYFDKYADIEDDPIPPQAFEDINHYKFLSAPRNQGGCGSCWAHAATLTIEAQFNIKYNTAIEYLSVQELVDCSLDPSQGCRGGWMSEAYRIGSTIGLISEKDYSYTGNDGECSTNGKLITNVKINSKTPFKGCSYYSSYFGVPLCTKDYWYSLIKNGPVAVVLNAEDNFSFYKTGIIDSSKIDCSSYNHAVTAYAFLTEQGTNKQYIKIRNSWGTDWGNSGDISYYYNSNNETCWVTKMAFQPILD